jgi:hypothetical protein
MFKQLLVVCVAFLSVLKHSGHLTGSAYQRVAKAWIDWNINSVFDANEALAPFQLVTVQADPVELPITFTPPCDAVAGKSRLRVLIQESSSDPDPCLPFSYGGVKDFSIEILAAKGTSCAGGKDHTSAGRK